MSLFSCFNPACLGAFSTRRGLEGHMRRNIICAKYSAGTIMCPSSDESDSDTDSISVVVVEENNNSIEYNDNFSIGIDDDDDDDDNNHESKRQRISELFKESEIKKDGSFPISTDNLVDIMTPVSLPPRTNFQFSLLCLLSHPSIPLYIYPEVIRMINEMMNQNKNENSSQFKAPFPTSCKSILKQMSKNTPGTPIRVLPYPTKRGDENLSVVAFDAFSIIKEEVQNPTLWFQKNLAMPPESKWEKYVPIYDCDSGIIDLSE